MLTRLITGAGVVLRFAVGLRYLWYVDPSKRPLGTRSRVASRKNEVCVNGKGCERCAVGEGGFSLVHRFTVRLLPTVLQSFSAMARTESIFNAEYSRYAAVSWT